MLTKRSEYALRMIIVLATTNRIMSLDEISQNTDVPKTQAKSILDKLVNFNLLLSASNTNKNNINNNSYTLAQEPQYISIYDICIALQEPILVEPPMNNMIEISVFLNALIYGEAKYVFDSYTIAQIVELNKRNLKNRKGEPIKLKKTVSKNTFNDAVKITDGTALPLHPAHREILEKNAGSALRNNED